MVIEQKQIQEQLTRLQSKVKDIEANQQKLREASKTDDEASETDDEDEKDDEADEDVRTDGELSGVRNAELWVKELKDKVSSSQ